MNSDRTPGDRMMVDELRVDVVPEFLRGARELERRHARQEREFWSRVLGANCERVVYEVGAEDGEVTARFRLPDRDVRAVEVSSWAQLLPAGYRARRHVAMDDRHRTLSIVTLVRRLELVDLPPERPGMPQIARARRAASIHPERRREFNDRPVGARTSRTVPVIRRLDRRRRPHATEPERWLDLLMRCQPARVSVWVAPIVGADARRTLDAEVYEAILGRDPMARLHRQGVFGGNGAHGKPLNADEEAALSRQEADHVSFAAALFPQRKDYRRIRQTLEMLRQPSGELRSAVVQVVASDGCQATNLAHAWAEAHGGSQAYWISDAVDGSPDVPRAWLEPNLHSAVGLPPQLANRAVDLGIDERRTPRIAEIRSMMRDLETIFCERECRALLRLPIGPSAGLHSSLLNPFVDSLPTWRLKAPAAAIRVGRLESDMKCALPSSDCGRAGPAGGVDADSVWHRLGLRDLTRHALIVGSTGSGKSVATRFLLGEVHRMGVPFLAVEPVKTEYYDALRGTIPNLKRWRFEGTAEGKPGPDYLVFDPMRLQRGVSVARHISFLKSCFAAAFPLGEVGVLLLENALRAFYMAPREDGKDGGCGLTLLTRGGPAAHVVQKDAAGRPTVYPSYRAFVRFMLNRYLPYDLNPRNLEKPPEYALELHDAFRRRFVNLAEGQLGLAFQRADEHYIHDKRFWNPFPTLLERPTVVELDAIADNEQKALAMAFLLTFLYEHRQAEDLGTREAGTPPTGPPDLRHLLIVEEAHRLLGSAAAVGRNRGESVGEDAGARAVCLFVEMLAEIRAYGQGLMIVEQIPTKLVPEAVKNTNLKVMLRITAEDDREFLGTAMGFTDEQKRFVTGLRTGQCVVFEELLDRPVMLTIPGPDEWPLLFSR
jgi:hypothetical protein